MSKTDNILKLLIVETSLEDAEHIISVLRNAGLAVRPSRAATVEEVASEIESQPLDMTLIKLGQAGVSVAQLSECIARFSKDIPIIAYAPSPDVATQLDAIKHGAAAVVPHGSAEFLQIVARRELVNVKARRNLRRVEASLRESEKRCNSLLDSSRDAIAYVHEGMHVYANRAYLEMFGFDDPEDIEGLSILDMVDASGADTMKTILKQIRKGERPPKSVAVTAQTMAGGKFDASMEFSEASIEGEPCTQIVLRQQASDPAMAEELDSLRNKDLVTGLFNRTYLINELDHAVSEALEGRTDQALVFLEIDNMQSLLGTVGIGNTDVLLGDIANVLRQQCSEQDSVARVSEHAFCVVVRGRSHDAAHQFSNLLLKAFEEHIFEIGKQSLNLTVSVALVLIGEKSGSSQEVLEHGMVSCRAAAAEGGNRVQVFDPAAKDKAEAEKDAHWLHLLQDALAKDTFVLYNQPIISLHGAEGDYFEILLRLQGPKGEIMPGYFLPIAERHNLMGKIDRWVISNAIQMIAEREKSGTRSTCFIKVTPQTLEDSSLLPWLAQQLKQHRLRGDALVFEMPESKVVTSLKPVRQFQRGLEQLHCGFALEQFGSGLNSFQLLKHVHAQYLKVDRTFMADLAKSPESQKKVKEICEQAHALSKLTVAEHVEDAASMSLLFSWGVNFVQGNFLQEPEKVMQHDYAPAR